MSTNLITNRPLGSLKCLQVNLRHCRAAALHLSQNLLDLDVDIALIQEPYAVNGSATLVKYVPEAYTVFHCLSMDHAYGTTILVKKTLKASAVPSISSNEMVGVKLTYDRRELFLFSIYCRPSLKELSPMLSPLSSLSPSAARNAVLCLDSNARNILWNSNSTDVKGRAMENFLSNAVALVLR